MSEKDKDVPQRASGEPAHGHGFVQDPGAPKEPKKKVEFNEDQLRSLQESGDAGI